MESDSKRDRNAEGQKRIQTVTHKDIKRERKKNKYDKPMNIQKN
jgi:hypothetical protein